MKLLKSSPLKNLKDFIISKEVLFLLTLALFVIDFSLSEPIYVNLLDMPELGTAIALVFAFIIAVVPKLTAKLLAREKYIPSVIAVFLGAGLMIFIYVGQHELTLQMANDPLAMILNEGTPVPETPSNRHILVTALTGLLYMIATFASYLYYAEYESKNPKSVFQYKQTSYLRNLMGQLTILQGRFDRAFRTPTALAEATVHKQIEDSKKRIAEQERKLAQQDTFYMYQVAQLANTEKQIKATIQQAYNKKSFFNRLFKF